jgi:hypothetical protein
MSVAAYVTRRGVQDASIWNTARSGAVLRRYFYENFAVRPIFLNHGANTTAFWAGTVNARNAIVTDQWIFHVLLTGAGIAVPAPTWDGVNGGGLTFTTSVTASPTIIFYPWGNATSTASATGRVLFRPYYEEFFCEWKFTVNSQAQNNSFRIGFKNASGVAFGSGNSYYLRVESTQLGTARWGPQSGVSSNLSVTFGTQHTLRIVVPYSGIPSFSFDGALVESLASGAKEGISSSTSSLMTPVFDFSSATTNNSLTISSLECGLLSKSVYV